MKNPMPNNAMPAMTPRQYEAADLEQQNFGESGTRHIEGNTLMKGLEEEDASFSATTETNLRYENADEEPEIHVQTWIAVAAMCLLNFVQIIALQGPPVVLDQIGESLHSMPIQTWVPNALSLVQAVLAPIFSSASDTFQARKLILLGSCTISFIGAAIAPGSHGIYRLITAQVLIGFGFASTALAYCVPSEILPKKWRPMVQAFINVAAALGACVGPLTIGALTRDDPMDGWRNYYWFQMALWGATAVCIFLGYRPSKRHTRYDHLSFARKIKALDFPGASLFAAGLTLFLVGLNLGGGLFRWTNKKVLATLIVGIVLLVGFGVYECRATKTGMLHHDLFRGGRSFGSAFATFLALIFIEGIMLFAYIIFYPLLTTSLFEKDLYLLAAREQPFWIGGGISTVFWGYWSVKFISVRVPLFFGFLTFTAGIVGLATIQPSDSTRACVFAGLAGVGFGAPLILIIAGIQLATPHALIATGTSLAIASRAVSSSVFTAIYSAVLTQRLQPNIIGHVSKAVVAKGLPSPSVKGFIEALTAEDNTALSKVPGVTTDIIAAGIAALQQALADSLRVVFIIAAPFGAVACLLCLVLGDQSGAMTYRVDAPIEELHIQSSRSKPL